MRQALTDLSRTGENKPGSVVLGEGIGPESKSKSIGGRLVARVHGKNV